MTATIRLPKPSVGTRCSALDSEGRRCARKAEVQENYHGDDYFYGYLTDIKGRTWVRVAFCKRHRSDQ
jgi:hypothetical protein